MKRLMSFGSLTMLSLLLAPFPASAEMTVTVVNGSSQEIHYLYLDNGEGGMGSSMNLVPGNRINMTDGNATVLKNLSVFAGTRRYDFESVDLPGPEQVLRFVLHDDGVPALIPGGGEPAQKESFDVETGPIWNNDDAQKRCPEVLEAWKASNPGMEAEWTGNWATTVPGETSVCNIRVTNASGDAPQSSGEIAGKASSMLPGSDPVDLSQVMAARTISDLSSMNATEAPYPFTGEYFLPIKFAETTWLGRITAELGGAIRNITLHAPASEEVLANAVSGLSSSGYRPWFAYVKQGEKMEIADSVSIWNDADTQAEGEAMIAEAASAVFQETDPTILESLYISAKHWDAAVKGETPEAPIMRMHVASGKNLVLIWMSDGSMLIEESRGSHK